MASKAFKSGKALKRRPRSWNKTRYENTSGPVTVRFVDPKTLGPSKASQPLPPLMRPILCVHCQEPMGERTPIILSRNPLRIAHKGCWPRAGD